MQLFFTQQCYCKVPKHIEEASKYLFVTEKTGHNDGAIIYTWQSFVGVPSGSSYCAAFVSYIISIAKAVYPKIKTALAVNFITKESIKAEDVYNGKSKIDNSYIAIWRNGKTWKGHVGFVYAWNNKSGYVIEANTSSDYAGVQREGEGVYLKHRKIEPYKYFRIVAFTKIKYHQEEEKWQTLKQKIRSIGWLLL